MLATSGGVAALLVASQPAFVAPSLLPQFGDSFASLAAHGVAFAALTLLWLSLVACAGSLLGGGRVRRVLDKVTGVVLVAFGVRLATERR